MILSLTKIKVMYVLTKSIGVIFSIKKSIHLNAQSKFK